MQVNLPQIHHINCSERFNDVGDVGCGPHVSMAHPDVWDLNLQAIFCSNLDSKGI